MQLLLTYRQMRLFYSRYQEVGRAKRAAIANEGSIFGGRVYVVLVADRDCDAVVSAEKLSGWTVFAQLRPVRQVVGLDLDTVAQDEPIEGVSPKVRRAFRQAASLLVDSCRERHSQEGSDEGRERKGGDICENTR